MAAKVKQRKEPQIVLLNGKPSAVIIDINDYEEMLETIDQIEDLRFLSRARRQNPKFKKLEDFLKEQRNV